MPLVTFRPLPVREVVQGQGAIGELPAVLDRLGVRRALVITGRSLAERSGVVDRLRSLLGERLAGVFAGITQHTPSSQVLQAAEEARRLRVDSLISLGGGSPIDGTKAVAYALSRDIASREHLLSQAPRAPTQGTLPHVAVPTTLSAAECSFGAGITDEQRQLKTGLSAPDLSPAAVLYDPELTVHTPGWLWAATGLRAVDHAIETIYSPDHQPLTDVLAMEALRLLFAHLPVTTEAAGSPAAASPESLARRLLCQQAAWFSFYGAPGARMGLSHALGRRIGAHFGVPHGYTSAITLPPVMRLKIAQVPERLRLVARAIGLDRPELSDREAAEQAARAVQDLVRRLGLPTRLGEVGIREADLDWIAEGRPEVVELLRSVL